MDAESDYKNSRNLLLDVKCKQFEHVFNLRFIIQVMLRDPISLVLFLRKMFIFEMQNKCYCFIYSIPFPYAVKQYIFIYHKIQLINHKCRLHPMTSSQPTSHTNCIIETHKSSPRQTNCDKFPQQHKRTTTNHGLVTLDNGPTSLSRSWINIIWSCLVKLSQNDCPLISTAGNDWNHSQPYF